MLTSRLLLTDARHLEWIAEELPQLGPHDVLVQTRTGAISIGSELPHYCGTSRGSHPIPYPRMTGYENVGTVLACGEQVQRIHAGDRVVAFYGHRTHAVVPEGKAIVIPDDISDALAILTILSCDAAKGVRKLSPGADERALITGAGTMGLLTLFILKAYGIASVDVVEPRVERHPLARELGASHVLLPQAMPDASADYALGFECSSRDVAFALLQCHMQQDGRICITADGNLEPLTLTPVFHEKELRLVASSDGWDYHEHAAWYFREVREHPTCLEQLFELRITSRELIATFEQLATGAIRPIKVLVDYSQ
jgi:alcohol dehydrogenase